MDILLSANSGVPLYQQLYLQISSQIVNGILLSGAPLPPIRTVAAELGISIITVKRAWEELERDGFIQTHVGRGTIVAPQQTENSKQEKLSMAQTQLEQDLPFYRTLGLSLEELIELIRRQYDKNG